MIPRDTVIHEGNDTEPELTWGTLYTLLQIATDPTCRQVCHCGPRHYYSMVEKPDFLAPSPIIRLTLNELIQKTMPVFKEIDKLHDAVAYHKGQEATLRAQLHDKEQTIDRLIAKLDAINEVINPE